jgi:hypothetical protein
MNEKDLNQLRQQDNNLREAIARRSRKCPQMPPDLNERLMERVEKKPRRSFPIFAKWMSAAACIVAALLIGNALLDKKQTVVPQVAKTNAPTAIKTETTLVAQAEPRQEPKIETPTMAKADVAMTKPSPPTAKVTKPTKEVAEKKDTATEEVPANPITLQPTAPVAEESPQLIYASTDEETEEDSTYQSPGKVDEFIAKLAANYGVSQELPDSIATGDSNISNAIYVFPDKLEADVMLRLMQIACWYGNTSPGYKLYMTQQQFLFELDDTRKGRRHMWFAEKANKCTLLYCASAPIGEVISTACYLEFKEKTSREITNM